MKPQRPYLFDAIYRWVLDNQLTPYLLVDVNSSVNVSVPMHLVQDNQIVLNISISAINNFEQDDIGVSFSARFSGKSERIIVPFEAMVALYAKETAQGIVFPDEQFSTQESGSSTTSGKSSVSTSNKSEKHKSSLRVVK